MNPSIHTDSAAADLMSASRLPVIAPLDIVRQEVPSGEKTQWMPNNDQGRHVRSRPRPRVLDRTLAGGRAPGSVIYF